MNQTALFLIAMGLVILVGEYTKPWEVSRAIPSFRSATETPRVRQFLTVKSRYKIPKNTCVMFDDDNPAVDSDGIIFVKPMPNCLGMMVDDSTPRQAGNVLVGYQ